jgi:hypothetical protein
MKKTLRLSAAVLLLMGALTSVSHSQQTLNQVIAISGGVYSNPNDYVTAWTLNPANGQMQQFDQIETQSVQSAYVHENYLYVAAMDSLVMYDLDTHARLAAIALDGVNHMLVVDELLFVSIQFPQESDFVRIFNSNDLSFLQSVSAVSDEAATMLLHDDKVYVAVPGNWMSTTGSLAILDAATGQFIEEINLGEQALGIHSLYVYQNNIVMVNRSAWGSSTGTISLYDPADKSYEHHAFKHSIGKGIGLKGNLLYVVMDDGIGSVNLQTMAIENPAIVADPGSGNYIYFAAVAFDSLNNQFYATTTDYISFGSGFVYDLAGELVSQFEAGISTEALAFDYRNSTAVAAYDAVKQLTVYPNPAQNTLQFSMPATSTALDYFISNAQGQIIAQGKLTETAKVLDISSLAAGFYLLRLSEPSGLFCQQSFIKQ